jgi:hypothetical protein
VSAVRELQKPSERKLGERKVGGGCPPSGWQQHNMGVPVCQFL